MNCRVLCGDETLYEGEATLVVARSDDGEFAVMDGHEPMLAALRPGALRVETASGARVFRLAEALLRVAADGVSVVAAGLLAAEGAEEAGSSEASHGEGADG